MPEIDARLETGELSPKLILQTERSYGTVLDIEFAPHVTVGGSPDAFREFARELLDLVDTVTPQPLFVFDDIPPRDGLELSDPPAPETKSWVRPRDEHGRAYFAPNEVPPADEHFAHWQGRLTHPEAFCNGGDAKRAHAPSAPLSLRCVGGWIPSGGWWLHCPVCRTAEPVPSLEIER